MTSLEDIRKGLAQNLSAIPNLQTSPYLLGTPTPPAAEVVPGAIDYDLAMGRGLDRWRLTVRVFVGLTTDRGAQVRLDRMIASAGPQSVKQALEADCSLNGTVDDLRVVNCSGYRQYGDQQPILGCEFEVEVYA